MKKFSFLSICITFVLLLSNVAYAASDFVDKNDIYAAYYELLKNRLDAVGVIQPSTIESPIGATHDINNLHPKQEGIFFAKLVDFDNDGCNELFLIESVPDGYLVSNIRSYRLQWYVYSYKNGKADILASDTIIFGYYGFITDGTGKTYYYESKGHNSWDDFKYYSLNNGNFIKNTVSINWSYDWSFSGNVNGQYISGHSDSSHGNGSGFISSGGNSKYASANEIQALRDKLNSGSKEIYDYINRPADNTVQNLLNKIENNYLLGYNTPSDWAANTIAQAIDMGIVSKELQMGYKRPITRAEFCTLAVNFYECITGKTIMQTASFTDTKNQNVSKMGGMGVVTGVGNGKFNPNGLLTREEAAVILVRLTQSMGISLNSSPPTFFDNKDISSWALEQVGKVQFAKIMGGVENNNFLPQSLYTRQESIVTLMRLIDTMPSITNISLSESNLEILIGGSFELNATITPSLYGDGGVISWSSSNSSVVAVNQTGKITAIGSGSAIITATAPSGVSSTCTVDVVKPQESSEQFYVNLPVTLNCLNLPLTVPYAPDFDYKPSSSQYGGKIQITDIEENIGIAYNQIKIKGIVLDVDNESKYFCPYIRWIVENSDGKVVKRGMEVHRRQLGSYKAGSEFEFEIFMFYESHRKIDGLEYDLDYIKDDVYFLRFVDEDL